MGINGAELLVLLLVALIVLGPKGLQQALAGFKSFVTWVRSQSQKLREESKLDLSSAGLDGFDWSEFDLSEYDPREIIREAVKEEMDAWIEQAKGEAAPGFTPRKPQAPSGSMQPQQDSRQQGNGQHNSTQHNSTQHNSTQYTATQEASPQNPASHSAGHLAGQSMPDQKEQEH